MHVAADLGNENFIMLLLSRKADANIRDLDGYTPLDLAAKNKHESAAEILLEYPPSSITDGTVQMALEHLMSDRDIKDVAVKEKISEMSPFGYALRLM